MSALDAIDRDLAELRAEYAVAAPRIGCSLVSHEALSYCAACASVKLRAHPYLTGQAVELTGWRLLALRQKEASR